MNSLDDIKKNEYWDSYYLEQNISKLMFTPSQFAVFCIQEVLEAGILDVVEIAAGSGRDAVFFAQHGMRVLALDKSKEAVNLLNRITEKSENISVSAQDVIAAFPVLPERENTPYAFYARFFIHTLTEYELKKFFENISKNMNGGDLLFLEYRNEGDAVKAKVTKDHFRAFYSAQKITSLGDLNNLRLIYEVSGTGFAKWKNDDASVTRQIFRR